jgi:hypothetical protein
MSRNERQPQVALFLLLTCIALTADKVSPARVEETFDRVGMLRQFMEDRNDEIVVPGLDARIQFGIVIRELEDAWLTAQVAVWEQGVVLIDKFRHF